LQQAELQFRGQSCTLHDHAPCIRHPVKSIPLHVLAFSLSDTGDQLDVGDAYRERSQS